MHEYDERKRSTDQFGSNFDLPKLEMLNYFQNIKPLPSINKGLKNNINLPISDSERQ